MSSKEIFPFPTVKEVIFQITFPNLFYLEDRIGDFQSEIMEEFPQSSLSYKRQILLADIGPNGELVNVPDAFEKGKRKIWQFSSTRDYSLNLASDSLSITSRLHKTYNNPESHDKFRDIIDLTVSKFLDIAKIPMINRIGLRYVDDCPIRELKNEEFSRCYNTKFPIDKINIAAAKEMTFMAVIEKQDCLLRYIEALLRESDRNLLKLDFDAFKTEIRPPEFLATTDKLYDLIAEEYERTIKDPVREYMRKGRWD
jgi:uncharacterized protein (TIGR04255 family)